MNVNDVSFLNKTTVNKIFYVKNINQIQKIILLAQKNNKKISIAGSKHSMGGHILCDDCYYIDITKMKKMKLINNNKLRVESGATFCDIIKFLNKFKKTVCSMQSYCNFTIGGSISVNAHGIISDKHISETVCELTLINSNGEIKICSNKKNKQLFKLSMGGYGMFGIIYDCVIKIQNNCLYTPTIHNISAKSYNQFAQNNLLKKNIFKITRINMSDLNNYMVIVYKKNNNVPVKYKYKKNKKQIIKKIFFNYLGSTSTFKYIRSIFEIKNNKPIDFEILETTPNQLMNYTTDVVTPLTPYSIFTFILQEYFIPFDKFNSFIKNFNTICSEYLLYKGIILLNVTIRIVNKDNITYLKYAKKKVYAFVLYFKVFKIIHGTLFKDFCNRLINLTLKNNGTFYLPYSLFFNKTQLLKAYPNFNTFIKHKKKFDKNEIFFSNFYKYCYDILN